MFGSSKSKSPAGSDVVAGFLGLFFALALLGAITGKMAPRSEDKNNKLLFLGKLLLCTTLIGGAAYGLMRLGGKVYGGQDTAAPAPITQPVRAPAPMMQ